MIHPEERGSGEALYLWRVSLMGTVELGAYSKEEAMYQAVQAIVKSGEHVLRPFRLEKLGVLELGTEEKEDEGAIEEEAPIEKAEGAPSEDFGASDQLLRSAGMFNADAELKAKWIRELSEKITQEVTEKMAREGTSKPIPIPLE